MVTNLAVHTESSGWESVSSTACASMIDVLPGGGFSLIAESADPSIRLYG
jgi:hypothetical protein